MLLWGGLALRFTPQSGGTHAAALFVGIHGLIGAAQGQALIRPPPGSSRYSDQPRASETASACAALWACSASANFWSNCCGSAWQPFNSTANSSPPKREALPGRLKGLADAGGRRAQQFVARRVAQGIVYELEIVEIHHKGQAGPLERAVQRLFQRRAAAQAGERIHQRQPMPGAGLAAVAHKTQQLPQPQNRQRPSPRYKPTRNRRLLSV